MFRFYDVEFKKNLSFSLSVILSPFVPAANQLACNSAETGERCIFSDSGKAPANSA